MADGPQKEVKSERMDMNTESLCKAREKSSILRTFWLGKQLGDSQYASTAVYIREELTTLMTKRETSLSRSVFQMVSEPLQSLVATNTILEGEALNDGGTIVWDKMDFILAEGARLTILNKLLLLK